MASASAIFRSAPSLHRRSIVINSWGAGSLGWHAVIWSLKGVWSVRFTTSRKCSSKRYRMHLFVSPMHFLGGEHISHVISYTTFLAVQRSCRPLLQVRQDRFPARHGGGSRAEWTRRLVSVFPLLHAAVRSRLTDLRAASTFLVRVSFIKGRDMNILSFLALFWDSVFLSAFCFFLCAWRATPNSQREGYPLERNSSFTFLVLHLVLRRMRSRRRDAQFSQLFFGSSRTWDPYPA